MISDKIRREYQKLGQKTANSALNFELKNLEDESEGTLCKDLTDFIHELRDMIDNGKNRMNTYVVARAARGLGECEPSKNDPDTSLAIGHDFHIKSDTTSYVVASIFFFRLHFCSYLAEIQSVSDQFKFYMTTYVDNNRDYIILSKEQTQVFVCV